MKKIISQVEEVLRHRHAHRFFDYQVNEKTKELSYWIKEDGLKLDQTLDGVYILRTGEHQMRATEIINAYKDLTDVERAFRTMKSVLGLRPFYHWTEARVRAHAFICYLAFLIERYVERTLKLQKSGFSSSVTFKNLSQLRAATMEVDGQRYSYFSESSWRDRIIFKALRLKAPPRCVIESTKKTL